MTKILIIRDINLLITFILDFCFKSLVFIGNTNYLDQYLHFFDIKFFSFFIFSIDINLDSDR